MNETAPVRETHALHQEATTDRFERAFRLYRRRVGRCRTENQSNRLHIALDNYMTPAEVRYFAAALAQDAADSFGRRWITTLVGSMPIKKVRSVEFERTELRKGVSLYSTNDGSRNHKTLVIGIAGLHHRLMAPTSYILDCLNPALYDVVLLRDFSRVAYALGIHGLGDDFHTALSKLEIQVSPSAYRNTIAFGTSLGGIPAILASILLRLDRAVAIGPQAFSRITGLLRRHGLADEPYVSLLAMRPQPFPEVLLVCAAEHDEDVAAATSLQQQVPARVVRVRNCSAHVLLAWHHAQRTLAPFLAKVFGQSLEDRSLTTTTAAWVVDSSNATSTRPTPAGA